MIAGTAICHDLLLLRQREGHDRRNSHPNRVAIEADRRLPRQFPLILESLRHVTHHSQANAALMCRLLFVSRTDERGGKSKGPVTRKERGGGGGAGRGNTILYR